MYNEVDMTWNLGYCEKNTLGIYPSYHMMSSKHPNPSLSEGSDICSHCTSFFCPAGGSAVVVCSMIASVFYKWHHNCIPNFIRFCVSIIKRPRADMHGWQAENGDIIWGWARAKLYVCVRRTAEQNDFIHFCGGLDRVQGLQFTQSSSLDVPHSPHIPPSQLSPPLHRSIAYSAATRIQRYVTVQSFHFCCDLHRVACHDYTITNTNSQLLQNVVDPYKNTVIVSLNYAILSPE